MPPPGLTATWLPFTRLVFWPGWPHRPNGNWQNTPKNRSTRSSMPWPLRPPSRAEAFASLAVEETGYGVVADKVQKNLFSSQKGLPVHSADEDSRRHPAVDRP